MEIPKRCKSCWNKEVLGIMIAKALNEQAKEILDEVEESFTILRGDFGNTPTRLKFLELKNKFTK